MKARLLASVGVILSAATAYAQAPPPPPIIIGIAPETRTGPERIVVTGLVEKAADGSPVIRAGEREYQLPPTQYSLLLPHLNKTVHVVGAEQRSERGERLLVVDHIIMVRARETPRR